MDRFKSRLRTAEVHKWSSLTVLLQRPSFEESNAVLKLTNILLSMWRPLLELLNDQIPSTTAGSDSGSKWLNAIMNNDIAVIQEELNEIKKKL